ncbi:MAG TPA: endo-1,4-beta-xylanase [Polyangiaceae bacterium]|nr:endo-1,4-beta-xylanase [Polyangiaceae bacterium]
MKTWQLGLRRIAKILLYVSAAAFALAILAAAYLFWPRSYARTYVDAPATTDAVAPLASAARFRLGAAVHDTEVDTFAAAAGRDFNSMTPANATKWGNLLVGGKLGKYDFTTADALVELALAKATHLRGHALVWGRYPGAGHPSDLEDVLKAAPDPKQRLEQILREHIDAVLAHFHGRIPQWDVVNEPLHFWKPIWDDNVFYRTLGPEFVATAFRLAHAADPSLELVLNEQLPQYDDEHAEKFFEIVQQLQQSGVPVHGVGLQSHVLMVLPSVASLEAYMHRIAELGLFIEITELDVRLRLFADDPDPYAAQGRYFRDLAAACARQPACRGITLWGISDRFTWIDEEPPFRWMQPNDPLLFDQDNRRKPAYLGIIDALRRAPPTRTGRLP